MPRVRFLTPVATADGAYHAGDTADVAGPLASAWAKNGNAEIVRGEVEIETTEAEPAAEKPARRRTKKAEAEPAAEDKEGGQDA